LLEVCRHSRQRKTVPVIVDRRTGGVPGSTRLQSRLDKGSATDYADYTDNPRHPCNPRLGNVELTRYVPTSLREPTFHTATGRPETTPGRVQHVCRHLHHRVLSRPSSESRSKIPRACPAGFL